MPDIPDPVPSPLLEPGDVAAILRASVFHDRRWTREEVERFVRAGAVEPEGREEAS